MTKTQRQIQEIDSSKKPVNTGSTVISTTAFELPSSTKEQITKILAERRAALQTSSGGRAEQAEQVTVAGH